MSNWQARDSADDLLTGLGAVHASGDAVGREELASALASVSFDAREVLRAAILYTCGAAVEVALHRLGDSIDEVTDNADGLSRVDSASVKRYARDARDVAMGPLDVAFG